MGSDFDPVDLGVNATKFSYQDLCNFTDGFCKDNFLWFFLWRDVFRGKAYLNGMQPQEVTVKIWKVGRKPNGKELQFIDYCVCHRCAFGMFQLTCNVRTEAEAVIGRVRRGYQRIIFLVNHATLSLGEAVKALGL